MKTKSLFSVKKMHILIIRCAFLAVSSKGSLGYKVADMEQKALMDDKSPITMLIDAKNGVKTDLSRV